jgi:hypothetical protein
VVSDFDRNDDQSDAVGIRPDGRIVAAGVSFEANGSDRPNFAVLIGDGTPPSPGTVAMVARISHAAMVGA